MIKDIFINNKKEPIGVDGPYEIKWSYKLTRGLKQLKYNIKLIDDNGNVVWKDSEENDSIYARICDIDLGTSKVYKVYLNVETSLGIYYSETFFETGLNKEANEIFSKSKWIGADDVYLSSDRVGVFEIHSEFQFMEDATNIELFFAEGDYRLEDEKINPFNTYGENYISYEIEALEFPAKLIITRVGYNQDKLVDSVIIDKEILNINNIQNQHKIVISVSGNCAICYLDEQVIDTFHIEIFGHKIEIGRVLNPLGENDVNTYPKLNNIGFMTKKDQVVKIDSLDVIDYRSKQILYSSLDKPLYINNNNGEKIRYNPSKNRLPILKKNFKCAREVKKVVLYCTSRGIYDLYVNGENLTTDYFNPGASQFDKSLYYQTYDITNYIQEANSLNVILSSGWWSDSQTFALKNYNFFGTKPSFNGYMKIEYTDGYIETVNTDESWKYTFEGPYIYSSFFHGETYDFNKQSILKCENNLEIKWDNCIEIKPQFYDEYKHLDIDAFTSWPALNAKEPNYLGKDHCNVVEYELIEAKSCYQLGDKYIYDLGQEIAGIPFIEFQEEKGKTINIRFSEMVYPNMKKYDNNIGKIVTENLRDAECRDTIITSGNVDIFKPKFTFHGFRYIEISGISKPLELDKVRGIQLSSVKEITGNFICSNESLNKFFENVTWSNLSNFISIPTDCPQRNERMGWLGDTHVFCKTANLLSDNINFYKKNLDAIVDLQLASGKLPNIAPFGSGFGGITYESGFIFIINELYESTGNINIINEYYKPLVRWMDYIKQSGLPGKVFAGPLADWLSVEETDEYLVWNAFYCRVLSLFHKFNILLNIDDQDTKNLYVEAFEYWNNTFINEEGYTVNHEGEFVDTQCSYAIAIEFDLVKDNSIEKLSQRFIEKTERVNYSVNSGFFGTPYLNSALSKIGYNQHAYKMMVNDKYPSWLYPVTQGATTIWERWNSFTEEEGLGDAEQIRMNSFNHYSFGSVTSWIFEYILGIKKIEGDKGFYNYEIKPNTFDLEYFNGRIYTIHGDIVCNYNNSTFYVEVPSNTTCEFILNNKKHKLMSGAYSISAYE